MIKVDALVFSMTKSVKKTYQLVNNCKKGVYLETYHYSDMHYTPSFTLSSNKKSPFILIVLLFFAISLFLLVR